VIAQEDVARYLMARELLGPEALLDGDLAIRDASSRNRNFRVERSNGQCYLLKQGTTEEAAATVAHEAIVYEQLTGGTSAMAGYLPGFHGYDRDEGVLVLELLRDAQDLRTLHLAAGAFAAGPASILGTALGTLHGSAATPALAPNATLETPPASAWAPWVLWLHRPDARLFRDVSAAALELIRVVQGADGFAQALDRARSRWRAQMLVHGDVKWDNCLVSLREDGSEELRLIDWESAAPGDPCWDIGSALSHYMSFWLFSIPVTGAEPPERFPELARYQLDSMKPALSACWIAYVDARELDSAGAAEELIRAVELAGARLVQTAFEAAQMMQQLTSALVLHLQLALNILEQPEEAATRLLGLPVARARAV
jgi:phosphotransferase family enzyme